MRSKMGKRKRLRVMKHCILVVHAGKMWHVAIGGCVHKWPRQVMHVGTIRLKVLQFRLPWTALVLNSVFVHRRLEALGKAASSALISVGLVDGTAALQFTGSFTRVNSVPVDAAFKETGTTVTAVDAIVFS